MANDALFDEVRALGLDPTRYVITGSGPLGIRGLREINEVDLMVDDDLFDELAQQYRQDGDRVIISDAIEAFCDSAFPEEPGVPSVRQQITAAEMLEGLPFVAVETVIAIKMNKGREKDLADVDLLNSFNANHPRRPRLEGLAGADPRHLPLSGRTASSRSSSQTGACKDGKERLRPHRRGDQATS